MALVLSGERPANAAVFTPLSWFAGALRKASTGRAQRQALKTLLTLEPYRLDDLGINRGDLFDAINAQADPTRLLAQRRARRHG
ncbi:MAG: hypothetical protein ABI697_14200 [Devosia sp.]